jgi:hypothetical protein
VNEYTLQDGGTVNYTKLMPITLDGLTIQVTWSASERSEARTTASQAQRHARVADTLDQVRDRLNAKRDAKRIDSILAHEIGGVLV